VNTPVVVARGLTKMWSTTAGLRAVDLNVSAGELVVIRGRSGSGKSTLIAVLAGWCPPDAGVVAVDGQPPGPDEPWERIALVPQALCLAVELSVRENVADAAGDHEAVDALLDQLDLTAQARRTLGETSSGQQQRVALARALVAAPRLLLADEPTSFQDGGHVATVVAALREAASAGSAVVVATHDPAVIVAADQVLDLAGTS
jgi:putative ABC transport system ATP-binding protein